MNGSDWPPEAPPPEAYSRVTNPERFLPLHARALGLVDRLVAEFAVIRTETFALLPGMQPFEHAQPPVTLTPAVPEAAPLAIAFTSFPSLLVRYGRWLAEPFPACGCDACAETAAEEGERLDRVVGDVVAGHLREELVIPWFGAARLRWARGRSATRGGSHGEAFQVLPRRLAHALCGSGSRRVQWHPWPPRGRDAPGRAPAI